MVCLFFQTSQQLTIVLGQNEMKTKSIVLAEMMSMEQKSTNSYPIICQRPFYLRDCYRDKMILCVQHSAQQRAHKYLSYFASHFLACELERGEIRGIAEVQDKPSTSFPALSLSLPPASQPSHIFICKPDCTEALQQPFTGVCSQLGHVAIKKDIESASVRVCLRFCLISVDIVQGIF